MTVEHIHLIAARWLERRHRSDWTSEDQKALDQWLMESGNKVAYLRVESTWQRTDRLMALRQPPSQFRQPSMRAEYSARNSIWTGLSKVAAGLTIAALMGALSWQQWAKPAEITYVTPIGGYKIITFEDGTRAELNTDTSLRVSKNTNERKVWLDKGEAYFEVEHDASRPFIVIAQGRKVTDLGTKFTVRQDAEKLHVAVVEGLVEVAATDHQPQSLLKPGDVLIATQESQSVVKKPLRALIAGLNWKNGRLTLEDMPLSEAAAEFNRYNSRKLVINDADAEKLTITGTFQTRNLDTFTKVASDIFGFKADHKDNEIILSR